MLCVCAQLGSEMTREGGRGWQPRLVGRPDRGLLSVAFGCAGRCAWGAPTSSCGPTETTPARCGGTHSSTAATPVIRRPSTTRHPRVVVLQLQSTGQRWAAETAIRPFHTPPTSGGLSEGPDPGRAGRTQGRDSRPIRRPWSRARVADPMPTDSRPAAPCCGHPACTVRHGWQTQTCRPCSPPWPCSS